MDPRIGGKVERVDGRQLSYRDFVERFLKGNQPVVLTGLMDRWRACSDWVTNDGLPNLQFFHSNFGKSIVQVADCTKGVVTDEKRLKMSVSEFIKHWSEHPRGKDANDSSCNLDTHSLLYLKDWHFFKEYPEYVAYTTPHLFIDDWLNLYLDSHNMRRDSDIQHDKSNINCADYRFVYMGAKGTFTPLHADVFRSYSWSANVCGKKLWLLLPPSQCHLVFDRNMRTSVYDVYGDVSETRFPGFTKTVWWECTQEQNEIIFVPSGWYHQVHNLEDTISINHNWFNSYNLSWVWNLLLKDYNEAREYIDDIREICDDFESLCQRNLAANTGMNFYDFFIFITRFALANLALLYHLKELGSGARSLIGNLKSICAVASNMKSLEAFSEENLNNCSVLNHSAFDDVECYVKDPEFLDLCMALMKTSEAIGGGEHGSENTSNSAICVKDWLNYLREGYVNSDFSQLSSSKIHRPEDLVRLIEHNISNHCSIEDTLP